MTRFGKTLYVLVIFSRSSDDMVFHKNSGLRECALFAGAGGGILGGMLCGWQTVVACEIEEYPRALLLQRQLDGILPRFPVWDDIRTFDGRPWRGHVDIVTGGFPCQDISAAGKGAGLAGERSGLWKEMARVVSEIQPQYVFVENSPMLTGRGLDVVLGDLATMGYDAKWAVLGAFDAGAPHRRQRIWIAAYSSVLRCDAGLAKQSLQGTGAYGTARDSVADSGGRRLGAAGGGKNKWQGGTAAECPGENDWRECPQCREEWPEEFDYCQDCGTKLPDTDGIGSGARWTGRFDSGCTGEQNELESQKSFSDADQIGCDGGAWTRSQYAGRGEFAYGRKQYSNTNGINADSRRHGTGEVRGEQSESGTIPWQESSFWWGSEPGVDRVANGVANGVDRLKALGNGQVPAVVALAWNILTEVTEVTNFKDEVQDYPIAEIICLPMNSKDHPSFQIEELKQNIETYGFTQPILVSRKGELALGEGRLTAVKQMGWKTVPAVVKDLTTDQVRALRLADNKIATLGITNEEAISMELADLSANSDISLDGLGFTSAELEKFLGDFDTEAASLDLSTHTVESTPPQNKKPQKEKKAPGAVAEDEFSEVDEEFDSAAGDDDDFLGDDEQPHARKFTCPKCGLVSIIED